MPKTAIDPYQHLNTSIGHFYKMGLVTGLVTGLLKSVKNGVEFLLIDSKNAGDDIKKARVRGGNTLNMSEFCNTIH